MSTEKRFGKDGWTPKRVGFLKGKTYVITGTTTRTGYEATKKFLSKGAKVVMLNRNTTNSNAVINEMKKKFGTETGLIIRD